MGLTIHYSLKLDTASVELAKEKLTALHQAAKDLPFAKVGELVEFQGDACHFDRDDSNDPHHWLKLHAYKYVREGDTYASIPAQQAIAFTTWPGEGCESATFGLAVHLQPQNHPVKEWYWSSFCKTQYASNPDYGGIEHFLKCHLLIVKLLDSAQVLGLLNEVSDEGNYWKNRNLQELVEAVGYYNHLVAAVVGRLDNLLENSGQRKAYAPIAEFPNFEYLEAEGIQQLDRGEV